MYIYGCTVLLFYYYQLAFNLALCSERFIHLLDKYELLVFLCVPCSCEVFAPERPTLSMGVILIISIFHVKDVFIQ